MKAFLKLGLLLGLALLISPGSLLADVTVTEQGAHDQDRKKTEKVRSLLLTGGGGGSLIDGSDLEYFVNTDVTFTTAESASGSASDATYTHAVAASTSGGGTTMTTLSDAFDGYNGICFADSPGMGECDPGFGDGGGDGPPFPESSHGFTVYNDNGPASLGCDDCELILQPQTIGNLVVSRRTFVPDDDEFIRFMTIMTNTGGATESVNLLTANNLGSDSNTEIFATSSGDLVVTTADHWIGSFQAFDGSGQSFDPRLGHVIQGPGAAVPVGSISFSDGQNAPYWEYNFDLAPGETAILLNFATGQPNQGDAIAKAQELTTLPEGALECMTAEEISRIINFAPPAMVEPIEVPTVGQWGLGLLALLLVASGSLLLWRRV